jgi:membrane protein YqaA with SNARE-associated domain
MRTISSWVLSVFASPVGVFVLAALDSTLFFSLPFGIDFVVILMAARLRTLAWIVPLLACAGSVAGAVLTFWMGKTIGEKGLNRYIATKRLDRIRSKIRRSGAIALAVLDLIPPPFPFTPFVIAAGALKMKARMFFAMLIACRLFRFGLETLLALVYGRSIVGWLDSDVFHDIVIGTIALAAALTVFSIYKLLRSTRTSARPSGLRAPA